MQDLHPEKRHSEQIAEEAPLDPSAQAAQAPDPLGKLVESVRDLLGGWIEQGRELASRQADAVEEQIRRRPGPALIAAASIGLVAGLWFARQRARRERDSDER